jgi:SAM-dependent methyltransferase
VTDVDEIRRELSRPGIARVHDALLGGLEGYQTDRDVAKQLTELCPAIPAIFADDRAFLGRAVTWAARQGISRFLDLGCGYTRVPMLHETVRDVDPRARFVYADHDVLVVSHVGVLSTHGVRGVGVVCADLTDPEAVFADPGVRSLTGTGKPVCVLLACVLHHLDAATAREVVTGYATLLAPGSVIAVSMLRCDDGELWRQIRDTYTAGPLFNHGRPDIARMLGGLELVQPGIVQARVWRGGMPDPGLRQAGQACMLAAVARKA